MFYTLSKIFKADAGRPRPLALPLLIGLLLIACQQQEAPTPAAETAEPTGETVPSPDEIIITRVVQQQIADLAATPDATQELVTLDTSLIGGGINTLDPQLAETANELDLVENLFVGLTRLNHVSQDIEPLVAQSWEVSPDGLEWTFTLREDIFWIRPIPSQSNLLLPEEPELKEAQVIRPIIADDFVFAIRRACQPGIGAPDAFVLFIIDGCEGVHLNPNVNGSDLTQIGVEALDPFTLRVRLVRPAAYFLTITSLPVMRPVPSEIVIETEGSGDWSWPEDGDEVISNGPFLLDPQTIRGTKIVLRRNPFWPIPISGNIDIVNLFQFQDRRDGYAIWLDRDLDITPMPVTLQEEIFDSIPQKVQLVPEQAVFYLAFNYNSPIFSRPGLRRAFGAAIDRQEIVDEVFEGRGLPMRHLTPPGVFAAPPAEELGIGFDPDFARQQMVNEGTTSCRFLPEIRYMVNSSDSSLFQAELIREMWVETLGCEEDQIIIEQVQFGTLLAKTRPEAGSLRPDIWDLGWASYYPDAHNWLHDILHCTASDNRVNRPCSEIDDQLERAGRAEAGLRLQLYRRLENDFFGGDGLMPIVPLYTRGSFLLRQTWVNFLPSTFGGEQFDTYQIDWELKKLEQQRQ